MAGPQTDPQRLRQLAILMSCLDAAAQQQLMLHLPTDVVRQVRHLVRNLGPVTEEEKRRVVDAFQQTVRSPRTRAATRPTGSPSTADRPAGRRAENQQDGGGRFETEMPSSDPDMPHAEQSVPAETQDEGDPQAPPWTRMEIDELVEFVQSERPTVIAVVAHQLPVKKAVEVLARLESKVSAQVVCVLAHMEEVDPEAKAAIDEYLRERLGRQMEQRATRSRVQQRIEALLCCAPAHLKPLWAAALQDPSPAADESTPPHASPSTTTESMVQPVANPGDLKQSPAAGSDEAMQPASAIDVSSATNTAYAIERELHAPHDPSAGDEGMRPAPSDIVPERPAATVGGERQVEPEMGGAAETPTLLPFAGSSAGAPPSDVDYTLWMMEFERLLDLPPNLLAAVMTEAGTETVLLALAGASPEFMRRFHRMLDRRDVRQLEKQLVELGPLSLEDIDRAQRRLLQLAELRTGREPPARQAA